MYTHYNFNKRFQSPLYIYLLLCQMQRNGHLSSNGGGNKGQAEPLRTKRARKNYRPQDRCLLSYSYFTRQFDIGNQMKVFGKTQDAICLLVRFFNVSSVYSQSIKNLSLLCRNKNQHPV